MDKLLTGKLLQATRTIPVFYEVISYCTNPKPANNLLKSLRKRIEVFGPITVHDYMKEALTNKEYGYYMIKDMFGKAGDFITSPEISQIFGEMIAVWIFNEWNKLGCPKPFQLVELGPGRGTLMKDILRVHKCLGLSPSDVSVHFVEVSQELSQIQGKGIVEPVTPVSSGTAYYQSGYTSSGIPVYWHDTIQQVPEKFSCIVAHEFFDALPIHILKKTNTGWSEVLIDLDESRENLSFVLSKNPTPACVFAKYAKGRDYFEISPQSGVIMEEISRRLEEFGGFSLIIDYGHEGTKTDTFRGFHRHKVVSPIEQPGLVDLTADVDFAFLKTVAAEKLISFGPVSQQHFLKQLHIDVRLQVLLKNCKSEKEKAEMLSGYHMIMDSDKMGDCFKFVSFFPAVLDKILSMFPVAGFTS